MRIQLLSNVSALAVAMLTAGLPAAVMAQDQEDPADIASLRSEVADLREREAQARNRVEELETRLLRLERINAEPISLDDAISMRGRFAAEQSLARPSDPYFRILPDRSRLVGIQPETNAGNGSVPGTGPGSEDSSDLKAPAPTAVQEEITEQQQGTFGRRIGLDLAMSYTHFDNARINLDGFLALDAIFLGTISIDRVTADIFTLEPTLDIGVSDRFYVNASVPLLSRVSNFQSGGAGGSASGLIERTVRGTGIGDANLGLSYRLLRETARTPDVVISSRVKFPTGRHPFGIEFVEVEDSEGNLSVPERLSYGTGVYGASLGVSLLKTLDPMIVFGSATYFRNFERSFADINEIPEDQPGKVKLGDAFQYGAGLAFALNDKSSISMSYTQRLVRRTRLYPDGQDPQTVVGSQANVALANLGATFSLGENIALVANLGIGLTDDSPDMAVSLRIPYRF